MTIEDRIAGCFLAGALGDAIGAHYEGNPPTSGFRVPPSLRVTDDTELTIATCESITDTIGAMFGHIFGAASGTGALPTEIVNQIDVVSLVRETAATFARTFISMNNRL